MVSFASFANLNGGAAADVFTFADGAGVNGTIAGGMGTDRLDFSAYGAANGVTAAITANNGGSITAPGVALRLQLGRGLHGRSGQ